MLVENKVYSNSYVGNGTATTFAISFPFLDNSHIEVYFKTGKIDVLVSRTEYTVTGANSPLGGTLTFNRPPANGQVITVLRNIPITQLYDYTELDNFSAESHENALAKITMICQQLKEVCDRSITIPVSSTENPEDVYLRIFDAAEKAERNANLAEQWGMRAESAAWRAASDVLNGVVDLVKRAEEAAIKAGNAVTIGEGQDNVEATWELPEAVSAESILDLPVSYFPGRNSLHLSYGGVELYPGHQYEEIGIRDVLSTKVRVFIDIREGMPMHAWVITSNAIAKFKELFEEVEKEVDDLTEQMVAKAAAEADRAKSEANRAKSEADRAKNEADRAETARNVAQNAAEEATEQANRADEAAVDAAKSLDETSKIARSAQTAIRCIRSIVKGRGIATLQDSGLLEESPSGFFIINPSVLLHAIWPRTLIPIANEKQIPEDDGFYLIVQKFEKCPTDIVGDEKPSNPGDNNGNGSSGQYWSEECGKRIRK